jgi:hypothetical protein
MYRKLSVLAIVISFQLTALHAQMNDASAPVPGQITLPDNSQLSGSIKDNIRKKGEVTFEVNGKKKKYKAGEVSSVQMGDTKYISINYTFYQVLSTGNGGTILRKANEPSEVQYNGNEAILISSEGKVDDLFIQTNANNIVLINKKNASEVLSRICPAQSNNELAVVDATSVRKALDNCK